MIVLLKKNAVLKMCFFDWHFRCTAWSASLIGEDIFLGEVSGINLINKWYHVYHNWQICKNMENYW